MVARNSFFQAQAFSGNIFLFYLFYVITALDSSNSKDVPIDLNTRKRECENKQVRSQTGNLLLSISRSHVDGHVLRTSENSNRAKQLSWHDSPLGRWCENREFDSRDLRFYQQFLYVRNFPKIGSFGTVEVLDKTSFIRTFRYHNFEIPMRYDRIEKTTRTS